MDSQEEDIFHIGINDVDSDDNEEIEHVHRIHEAPLLSIRDEGQ